MAIPATKTPVINVDKFTGDRKKLADFCGDNPHMRLITALCGK